MPSVYGAIHDQNIEGETSSTMKIGNLRALGVFSLLVLGVVALVHSDDALFQTEHQLNVVRASLKAAPTGNMEDCNNGKHDATEHGVDCGGVCVDRICDCVGNDVVKPVDEGKCSWTDNSKTVKPPTAWDNSGEWKSLEWTGMAIVSPSAADLVGKVYDEGHNIVKFTATDASNNEAFCIAVVNVTDNEEPFMSTGSCPTNMEPKLNDACTVFQSWNVPGYTDACGDVIGHSKTTTYNETLHGTKTISKIYTATDRVGLSATCTFEITPKDMTSPIVDFSAMDTSAVLLDGWDKNSECVKGRDTRAWNSDRTTSLMALLRREVKDNCDQNDDLTFTFDPVLPSNGFMPVGETNLTVTVKDASNNIATTTVLLKVKDTEKPTFTECPNDLVFNLPDGQHTMKVEWNETELIVARDNDCSSANLVERENDQEKEPANGAMWSKGNYTIKYVATDASKNIAECSFVVAVIGDVTAPTMKGCVQSISMNTLLYTHYGIPGYHADDEKWPALTATDVGDMAQNLSTPITWEPNCGRDVCSLDGYAFPHGETKIVATATDSAGLTALCEFYVKVIDEQIPFWEDQNPNVGCKDKTPTGELDYQQCGGDTIVANNKINATKHYEVELTTFKGKETCCDPSFTCMKINDHYSQCKPSLAPSASPTSTPTREPTNEPCAAPDGMIGYEYMTGLKDTRDLFKGQMQLGSTGYPSGSEQTPINGHPADLYSSMSIPREWEDDYTPGIACRKLCDGNAMGFKCVAFYVRAIENTCYMFPEGAAHDWNDGDGSSGFGYTTYRKCSAWQDLVDQGIIVAGYEGTSPTSEPTSKPTTSEPTSKPTKKVCASPDGMTGYEFMTGLKGDAGTQRSPYGYPSGYVTQGGKQGKTPINGIPSVLYSSMSIPMDNNPEACRKLCDGNAMGFECVAFFARVSQADCYMFPEGAAYDWKEVGTGGRDDYITYRKCSDWQDFVDQGIIVAGYESKLDFKLDCQEYKRCQDYCQANLLASLTTPLECVVPTYCVSHNCGTYVLTN